MYVYMHTYKTQTQVCAKFWFFFSKQRMGRPVSEQVGRSVGDYNSDHQRNVLGLDESISQ